MTALEKAARALATLDEQSIRRLNMYGIHRERYLAQARAVLMAVRPETDDDIAKWMACEFIDAILNEEPK